MTRRARITVVAEYRASPAEGINVVSRALVDGLRAAGREVRLVPPETLLRRLPGLLLDRAGVTVFTHGPGPRTVLASLVLRLMSPTRIVWVATRPDLGRCPGWLARWLTGWRTAHAVICNRARDDLAGVARGARVIVQPIGIPAARLAGTGARHWPDLRARGVPVALHVGHLRRNRGLDRLIAVKARLGDRIEIVVLASPYFEPGDGLAESLAAAGIRVERGVIAAIADAYRSVDLYLFPAPPGAGGAIELPLGVLEALACGLPVVSTRFGALPDVLEGTTGLRFAEADDFAGAVEAALDAGLVGHPAGLPPRLDAQRLTEHVLAIAAMP